MPCLCEACNAGRTEAEIAAATLENKKEIKALHLKEVLGKYGKIGNDALTTLVESEN